MRRSFLVGSISLALAAAVFAAGLWFFRSESALSGASLAMLALAASLYVLPAGLALALERRDAVWICAANLLLGWTLFGWMAALGWAAGPGVESEATVLGQLPHSGIA